MEVKKVVIAAVVAVIIAVTGIIAIVVRKNKGGMIFQQTPA